MRVSGAQQEQQGETKVSAGQAAGRVGLIVARPDRGIPRLFWSTRVHCRQRWSACGPRCEVVPLLMINRDMLNRGCIGFIRPIFHHALSAASRHSVKIWLSFSKSSSVKSVDRQTIWPPLSRSGGDTQKSTNARPLRFSLDGAETQRPPSGWRRLEKPFRNHPARVVAEVHLLNSGDLPPRPGIGNCAVYVVHGRRCRRRKLPITDRLPVIESVPPYVWDENARRRSLQP